MSKKIVFNEKQMAQVEALASVLTLEQMSDYFGIARNTFRAVCERQPEVLEHYKKGKARAIGNVAKNLLTIANEGNLTAIIFYLKTQAGWREQAEEIEEKTAPKPTQIVINVQDGRKNADPEHTTS
jgi:phage-related putative DNA binding protein